MPPFEVDVAREIARSLKKGRPRVEEPRKALERRITWVNALLDGRALWIEEEVTKLGIEKWTIPAYYAGARLGPQFAAEIRRQAQLAKDEDDDPDPDAGPDVPPRPQ